jgi:hypothetical protein
MREREDRLSVTKRERKEPQITTGGPLLTNQQAKELDELRIKKKKDA